jgi:Trehalose-phosphatase
MLSLIHNRMQAAHGVDHNLLFYSSTFAASYPRTALYVQVGEAAVSAGLRRHAAAAVQHLHQARQGGENLYLGAHPYTEVQPKAWRAALLSSATLLPSPWAQAERCFIRAVNAQVLDILRGLTADPKNQVYIISGRGKKDLGDWFSSVVRPSAQTATGCTVLRSRAMRICGSKAQPSTSCHGQHHATAAAGVFLQRPTLT